MTELFTKLPIEPEPKEQKVVERMADLVYKSFQYSQGDQIFQDALFAYIHTAQPDLQITAPQLEEIKFLALQKIYNVLKSTINKKRKMGFHI